MLPMFGEGKDAVPSGSWGGQRPGLAGYVTVTGPKHGDGTQARGARRRRAFMLPILILYDGSVNDSGYPTMPVLNTTSPAMEPFHPKGVPEQLKPSSRASRACMALALTRDDVLNDLNQGDGQS